MSLVALSRCTRVATAQGLHLVDPLVLVCSLYVRHIHWLYLSLVCPFCLVIQYQLKRGNNIQVETTLQCVSCLTT